MGTLVGVDEVAGVDIGTTATKAVAFAPDGAARPLGRVAYPLHEPRPDFAEQDATQVVEAVLSVLPDDGPVAFSAAMHSLVGVDDDGTPRTPLITWADTRAREQADRLRAEHPELHARTGTPLHPMSPFVKLCWLREQGVTAPRWCGIKELVLHRLTGEWVMDHSTASGTGLMALETLDWDPEALELAGVTRDQLPRLAPCTNGLRDRWYIGAGDGPLANLGVGAVRPGVAAVSIGTSGALRVMVEAPGVDEGGGTFCYALTPGRWAVGGAVNNGGVVLEWATEAFGGTVDELLAEAEAVPAGAEGLVMLPCLLSERAPHWSGVPRGAYIGLRRTHHRGHLVRAALEGVCRQLALVLAAVREGGHEVREVRATGGFARSPLWRQLLADVLGMPVGFPASPEGSAFGAALLGMEALGIVESIDLAAELVGIDEVVEPDPDAAALHERLLPAFAGLHDALAPAFRALHAEGRAQSERPGGA